MPEDTQVVDEAVVDETDPSTEAQSTEETAPKDFPIPCTINGVPAENLFQVVGTQGRAKGLITWLFKLPFNVPNPFANIMKIVSPEGWFRIVQEDVILPACKAATKAAFDKTTGKHSVTKFGEAFVGYFTATTRGGSGIRELKKKFEAKTAELMPYFAAQANPEEAASWTEEDMAHWRVLLTEWATLNAQIGEHQPKASGKKAKKAPATAVAA